MAVTDSPGGRFGCPLDSSNGVSTVCEAVSTTLTGCDTRNRLPRYCMYFPPSPYITRTHHYRTNSLKFDEIFVLSMYHRVPPRPVTSSVSIPYVFTKDYVNQSTDQSVHKTVKLCRCRNRLVDNMFIADLVGID